jgi:hypothetical protein
MSDFIKLTCHKTGNTLYVNKNRIVWFELDIIPCVTRFFLSANGKTYVDVDESDEQIFQLWNGKEDE